jgi:MoaA/NifB/PqqE/SkfB family radical SAM enzyme
MLIAPTAQRIHSLDGAALLFDRNTGMCVRIQNHATRHLLRVAPRVVMFGITNRCNLTCSFCSRDLDAPSGWTSDTAFDVLAGLAARGTLEVAFGGGEPFSFRGFDELVRRLANETSLALHATTNAVLLTRDRAAALRGAISELRISVYDDNPWFERASMLRELDMRVGLNVLVTPERLLALPSVLQCAAQIGVRDVAVLTYLGDDATLRLSKRDDEVLADMLRVSPIATRLSVCVGDRLDPLPRLRPLHADGDCGAGTDFVVITSDKKLKQCSFADDGIGFETASDIIRIWKEHSHQLAAPVARGGCARQNAQPLRKPSTTDDSIAIWNSFSANNSGDCTLVGRFETVAAAETFANDLLRDFGTDGYRNNLRSLLAAAQISSSRNEQHIEVPHSIAQVGCNVMVHGYDADDMLHLVRQLTWKRGGQAIHNGIHLHEEVTMLAAFVVDESRAEALGFALWELPDSAVVVRGNHVVATIAVDRDEHDVAAVAATLKTLEQQFQATVTAELATFDHVETPAATVASRVAAINHAMQHSRTSETTWLWATLKDNDHLGEVAETIGSSAIAIDRWLLWRNARPSGIAARILARGGNVYWYECEELTFKAHWSPKPIASQRGTKAAKPQLPFGVEQLRNELRARLGSSAAIATNDMWNGLGVTIHGDNEQAIVQAIHGIGLGRDVNCWLNVAPRQPLPAQLARLRHGLKRVTE